MKKTKIQFVPMEDKEKVLRELAKSFVTDPLNSDTISNSLTSGPNLSPSSKTTVSDQDNYMKYINNGLTNPVDYTDPTSIGDVGSAYKKGAGENNDVLGGLGSMIQEAIKYLGTGEGASILGGLSGGDAYTKAGYADQSKKLVDKENKEKTNYLKSVQDANKNAFDYGLVLQGQDNSRKDRQTDFENEIKKIDLGNENDLRLLGVRHHNTLTENQQKAKLDKDIEIYRQNQQNMRNSNDISSNEKIAAENRDNQRMLASMKASGTKDAAMERSKIAQEDFVKSLDQLEALGRKIRQSKITTLGASAKSALGMGSDEMVTYETYLNAAAYALARITNPVGVISNQDFLVAKNLLPKPTMDSSQRKAAFNALRLKYSKPMNSSEPIDRLGIL